MVLAVVSQHPGERVTGTLTVTTGNASDNDITITTGSATTSITASGAGDTITVNAATLGNNTLLTLTGTAAFVVTGLKGDLDAGAVTGSLDVTTGDNTIDNGITITTGSAATSITASGASDIVTVHASVLAQNTLLTLSGTAAFVVDGLVGNLDASGLSGTLTVTTGNAADNAITITTGSAATSITASGASDIVTVHASVLAQNTLLTLTGTGGVRGGRPGRRPERLWLGGTLTVTTGDASDNGISITTGSATTSITDNSSNDTVTVNASAVIDNTTVTLSGSADFAVTGLKGDLAATGVTGDLSVTTVDVASGLTIATGSGSNTIIATALLSGHVLTLTGSGAVAVTLGAGDLSASTLYGRYNRYRWCGWQFNHDRKRQRYYQHRQRRFYIGRDDQWRRRN